MLRTRCVFTISSGSELDGNRRPFPTLASLAALPSGRGRTPGEPIAAGMCRSTRPDANPVRLAPLLADELLGGATQAALRIGRLGGPRPTHVFRQFMATESQVMAQVPAAVACGSSCGGGSAGAV